MVILLYLRKGGCLLNDQYLVPQVPLVTSAFLCQLTCRYTRHGFLTGPWQIQYLVSRVNLSTTLGARLTRTFKVFAAS